MASEKAMDRARDHVEAALRRWKPIMGLAAWVIEAHYHRDLATVPKRYRPKKGRDYATLMWVEVQWEYLHATINVILPHLVGKDAEAVAGDVRHELAHVVINEVREVGTHPYEHGVKHEERVVSTLADAFLWTYNAGWNEGRDDLRKKRKGGKAAA